MTDETKNIFAKKAVVNGIETAFVGWYILSTGWEVYLTSSFDADGYADAFVQGAESEFGSVSFEEHKPYIRAMCVDAEFAKDVELGNLAPPIGGKWIEDNTTFH
ncbi:hypothetical protein WE348_21425 (plasmid) [Alteromonas macleodii]|uniref:hypothetical protein n=1 Tax=Alteromonas macleodii TaxID=28108 RepID=UPI0030D55173